MSNDVVKDLRRFKSSLEYLSLHRSAADLEELAERVDNALTNLARRVVETTDEHNRMYREIESFYLWMLHKEGTEAILTPSMALGEFESKPLLKAMVDKLEDRMRERSRS